MNVKRRLPAVGVAFAIFTGLGAVDQHSFWHSSWFFIGLGMTVSAVFVEPFFSRPQDAIVNSAGAITAYFTVDRSPDRGLWLALLVIAVCIAASGMAATVLGDSASIRKWAAFRVASRFGRAVVLGTGALSLIVLGRAASSDRHFEFLAAAAAALVIGLATDWSTLLARVRRRADSASAVAAIGPRMILAAASRSTGFHPGDAISVEARGTSVEGTVVARLPHRDGLRYQIALESDWTEIYSTLPDDLILTAPENPSDAVGAVAEGSTDISIEFEPFQQLEIGSPVSLTVAGELLLYQVAALRLVSSSWAGATALVSHATAHVVGWPMPNGWIRGGSYLPPAHEPINRVQALAGPLPDGFYRIGVLKGTEIALGLRTDDERRGHIAVLGMSGMGKTAVAQRICNNLGQTNMVVALDTTGEYATRLGVPAHADDLDTPGFTVYEPLGDPPEQAARFVKSCMEAGVAEYRAGDDVRSRVVLLEEAHAFVPEWNFALKKQQDHVAYSTRMIMQARKFGITFIIVSQRTAVVSKSALSQCENYIILKTIDQTSLEYLESVVGHQMRAAIPSLRRFEAICVGPAFNSEEPVIVTLDPP